MPLRDTLPAGLAGYLTLICLCLAPNLVWLAVAGDPGQALGEGLAPAAMLLGLVSAVGGRLGPVALLLAPLALLAPAEAYFIARYGRPSSAHVLAILADTHWDETRAYLGGDFWFAVATGAGLLLVVPGCVIAVWRANLAWRHRSRRWLTLAFGTALALSISAQVADPASVAFAQPDGTPPAASNGEALRDSHLPDAVAAFEPGYPAGVLIRLYSYSRQVAALRQMESRLADFRFGARQAEAHAAHPDKQVIVLVLGESSRRSRWQLYGYGRPTTPRLAAEPGLVAFSDMVTPWAYTLMSVPVILSRKPAESSSFFHPERSIVSLFREAGFSTWWLSTQTPLGAIENGISILAREAEHRQFLNPLHFGAAGAYDGTLIPALRQAIAQGGQRQFVVLHTLGSHYDYAHRYPREFEHFTPALAPEEGSALHREDRREQLSNSYDNSVRYTDHVLAEAIAALKEVHGSTALFYVADHGEDLPDEQCSLYGHNNSTVHNFQVPALLWLSPTHRQRIPAHAVQAEARRDSPLHTGNVFDTLADLAGIDHPGRRGANSLLDPTWRAAPRLVYAPGPRLWDGAVAAGPCHRVTAPPIQTSALTTAPPQRK